MNLNNPKTQDINFICRLLSGLLAKHPPAESKFDTSKEYEITETMLRNGILRAINKMPAHIPPHTFPVLAVADRVADALATEILKGNKNLTTNVTVLEEDGSREFEGFVGYVMNYPVYCVNSYAQPEDYIGVIHLAVDPHTKTVSSLNYIHTVSVFAED